MRVDMFDVEIESLRWFSTFTQRSLGEVEEVEIAPAAELAEEHRELAAVAGAELAAGSRAPRATTARAPTGHRRAAAGRPLRRAAGPGRRAHGGGGRRRGGARAGAERPLERRVRGVRRRGRAPPVRQPGERAGGGQASARASGCRRSRPTRTIELRAQSADTAARSLGEAEPELEKLVRSGYRTVVAFPRRGEGERAAYNLGRLKASWLGEGVDAGASPQEPSLRFAAASLREGFVAPSLKLAVFPEHRLLRRRRAERGGADRSARGGRGGARRGALRSFTELRAGDIVVHEDHGVARFAGFETRTVADVTRDYLYLEYQGDDRVFVPTDQLAKISRYVGAGGDSPPLSKLGGTRWETMKARARRAAQELSGELLSLYAERRRRTGHAFAEDSDWQREFEEAFPFTETPDQREAIELVKADMEAPRPMDRLICGDVGYGKTEVALRAAFKAANDGKQVLMLVPTTILALQHYGTFAERLADYPMTIEHVSRFRTPAEQKEAIKGFAEGRVDILIGTHRVLSRDVRAKELGPADRRRGAALRRQAEGAAAPAEAARGRDLDVGDADPAHAADVAGGAARHLGDRDAAGGPAAGEDVRGRVRGGAGQARDRARARARRTGVLPAQPRRVDRGDGRAPARAVPGRALRRRARPDGRGRAGDGDARLPARRRRRARVHVDHRVGHRHPRREHADRRARRRLRAGAALPDPRARRAQPRARVRLPALRLRAGAHRGGGAAPVGAVGLHRAGRRLQDRDARPGDPRRGQPARRRAVRARRGAGLRAVHADARRSRRARPSARRARQNGDGAEQEPPTRCAWT